MVCRKMLIGMENSYTFNNFSPELTVYFGNMLKFFPVLWVFDRAFQHNSLYYYSNIMVGQMGELI